MEGGDQPQCSPALQGTVMTLKSENLWHSLSEPHFLVRPTSQSGEPVSGKILDVNALKSPDDLATWLLNA